MQNFPFPPQAPPTVKNAILGLGVSVMFWSLKRWSDWEASPLIAALQRVTNSPATFIGSTISDKPSVVNITLDNCPRGIAWLLAQYFRWELVGKKVDLPEIGILNFIESVKCFSFNFWLFFSRTRSRSRSRRRSRSRSASHSRSRSRSRSRSKSRDKKSKSRSASPFNKKSESRSRSRSRSEDRATRSEDRENGDQDDRD